MKPVRIVDLSSECADRLLAPLLQRPRVDERAARIAEKVLDDIRRRGEAAILDHARRYDGFRLTAESLPVNFKELQATAGAVSPSFRKAAREAHRRIRFFARSGLRKNRTITQPGGGCLGERFVPFDAVGTYIPGGSAPLASTALMTVTLARAAGVRRIAACTPPSSDGTIDPHLLFALHIAGADEVYRIGGVQAIGLMAYGTKRIAPVQKIVGPGGAYVTAAKKNVYGDVALDMVAGPSEIAVIADASAPPSFVAADLLSQAEHGTGDEKALLITTSMALARMVAEEIPRQAALLSRLRTVETVIRNGMLLAVAPSLDAALELANRFAPEHLELMVRRPERCLPRITCAGAVFIGPWTPEVVGDFIAGPSHVLPTGGAAASFSGLTIDDFRRRISTIRFKRSDLKKALPAINAFGEIEGLDAHARSAGIRFENPKKTFRKVSSR